MKTWAEEAMEQLKAKKREDWTVEDYETEFYILNVTAEADYYDSLD